MNDGGPAFPHVARAKYMGTGGLVSEQITEGGMTLRDYFAAAALQGMLAAPLVGGAAPHVETWHFDEFSRAAYKCADEMLKAKEAK